MFSGPLNRCFSSHVFGSFGTVAAGTVDVRARVWMEFHEPPPVSQEGHETVDHLLLKTAESAVRVAGERINPCPWPPGRPTIENRHRIGRMPISLGMPERIEVHDRRPESARVWNLEVLLHLQRYCPTQRMADDASDVLAL